MGVAFVALVGFSAVLAELTLTPSPASVEMAGSNLRPGHSLRNYAEDYTFLAACKQIGGNLLLGAPFGVILPLLMPRRMRMVRVVMLTVLVMALVELAQGAMIEGRAFDVDDVILNTSGALIAYLLLGRRISRSFHRLGAEPEKVREKTKIRDKAEGKAQVRDKAEGKAKVRDKAEGKAKVRDKAEVAVRDKAKVRGGVSGRGLGKGKAAGVFRERLRRVRPGRRPVPPRP
ncbi:VanZ family protein [Streptomyces sp. NPDC093085]|uniref:VanZ family protein n=1 Tax=Streptomyces sp. NPDC093085 TaxID=3155068 RepID=UPI003414074C